MRRVSKPAVAALAAFLLAVALVACGGSDSSTSGATEAQAESTASTEASATSPQSAKHEGDGKSSGGGAKEEPEGAGPSASEFVPRHHNDSGGGSAQFKVKGGDNSVQEFGEEAGTSERDDAAAVLHDFLDARAEGNWEATCEYMSKSEVESLEKLGAQSTQVKDKSCAGVLEKLINPAAKATLKAEAEKADVGSLRVEGEQAFVIYTGTSGTVFAVPMVNEGGVWKVGSLTGAPLS